MKLRLPLHLMAAVIASFVSFSSTSQAASESGTVTVNNGETKGTVEEDYSLGKSGVTSNLTIKLGGILLAKTFSASGSTSNAINEIVVDGKISATTMKLGDWRSQTLFSLNAGGELNIANDANLFLGIPDNNLANKTSTISINGGTANLGTLYIGRGDRWDLPGYDSSKITDGKIHNQFVMISGNLNIGKGGVLQSRYTNVSFSGGTLGVLDSDWTWQKGMSNKGTLPAGINPADVSIINLGGNLTVNTEATRDGTGDNDTKVGAGKTITLEAIIQDDAEGATKGSITKTGKGTLVLTADNTYTGGTTVEDGILDLTRGSVSSNVTGTKTGTIILRLESLTNSSKVVLGTTNKLVVEGSSFTDILGVVDSTSGTGNTLFLSSNGWGNDPAIPVFGTAEQFSSYFAKGGIWINERIVKDGSYVLGGGLTQVDIVNTSWETIGTLTSSNAVKSGYMNLTLSSDGKVTTSLDKAALKSDGYDTITWLDSSWGNQGAPAYAATVEKVTGAGTKPNGWGLCEQKDGKYFYKNAEGKDAAAAIILGSEGANLTLAGGFAAVGSDQTLGKDIWLDVRGGNYLAVCGATLNNWLNPGVHSQFDGNIHVQVAGETKMGGYFGLTRRTYALNIKGNVYSYIGGNAQIDAGGWNPGDFIAGVPVDNPWILGNIYAGGFNGDAGETVYTGDLFLTVANVQTNPGSVFGGFTLNSNSSCAVNHEGSSTVIVNLDSSLSGTFAKNIFGGSYIGGTGATANSTKTGNYAHITGDAKITVSAPSSVTFSGVIAGGGYIAAGGDGYNEEDFNEVNMLADTYVTINGGTFGGEIYGGGYHTGGTGNALVKGNTHVVIDGGSFSADIHGGGGQRGGTGAVTVEKDTNVTLKSGNVSGNIFGGGSGSGAGVGGSTNILIGRNLTLDSSKSVYAGSDGDSSIGGGTNVTIEGVGDSDAFHAFTGTIYGGSLKDGIPDVSGITGDRVLTLRDTSSILAHFLGFSILNVKGTGTGTASVVSLGADTVNIDTDRTLSVALTGQESIQSLSGDGSLTLTSGILQITGISSGFSGGVTVSNTGTLLKAAGVSSLGTGNVTLEKGGVLQFGSGAFDSLASGSKIVVSGADSEGSRVIWDGTGNTKDISGLLNVSVNKELTLDTNGNNVTFASGIASGNFVKDGEGTLKLTSVNTYTGTTTVRNGVLDLAGVGVGSAGGAVRGDIVVESDGMLKLSVDDVTGWSSTATDNVASITLNGGEMRIETVLQESGSGNQTFKDMNLVLQGGRITGGEGASFDLFKDSSIKTLVSGTTSEISTGIRFRRTDDSSLPTRIDVADGGADVDLLISGNIADVHDTWGTNVASSFEKLGEGLLVLNGENTYSGKTIVSAGVLKAGSESAFGTSEISLAGGTLDLNGKGVGNALNVTGTANLSGASSFAGVLTLDGGILSGDSIKFSQTAQLKNGTINNDLTGTAGVVKTTDGLVTLGGAAGYTGDTVVSAGTLNFTQSQISLSNIRMSGKGVLSASNLTLSGESLLTLNMQGREEADASFLSLTGKLSVSSMANPNLMVENYSSLTPATYNLIGSDGTLLPSDFRYSLSNLPDKRFVLAMKGNVLVLEVSTIVSWTWNGTGADAWQGNQPDPETVWKLGEGATGEQTGPDNQSVWFVSTADSPSGLLREVSIQGEVRPSDLTISNDSGEANSFVFKAGSGDASIAGTTSLVKQGAGSLTIETHNTYSGGTSLEGGNLIVTNDDALGDGKVTFKKNDSGMEGILLASGEVTLDNEFTTDNAPVSLGTLVKSDRLILARGGDVAGNDLKISGSGAVALAGLTNQVVLSGTVSVDAVSTLQLSPVSSGDEIALSGVLSGVLGTIEHTGTGKLLLKLQNGNDSLSGNVNILNGQLMFSGWKSGGVTPASLVSTGMIQASTLFLTGNATLQIGTAGTSGKEGNVTVSGDSIDLGSENYAGGLIVHKGTLSADSAIVNLGQDPSNSGNLVIHGGTAVVAGIRFNEGSSASSLVLDGGELFLSGNAGIAGRDGTITLGGGMLTADGTWTMEHDLVLSGETGTEMNIRGEVALSGNLTGEGTLFMVGNGNLILNGTNGDGGEDLWNGSLVVNSGTVTVGHAGALTNAGVTVDGGILDLSNLDVDNLITVRSGSLSNARNYGATAGVDIHAGKGVEQIALGGLNGSSVKSILVEQNTTSLTAVATEISGLDGNLVLRNSTTLLLGRGNARINPDDRIHGVLEFTQHEAEHLVYLGDLQLGLTLELQRELSRNGLEGSTVILKMTNGRFVVQDPDVRTLTGNSGDALTELDDASMTWLKSIRFNPLLQYLGYAVKTADLSQGDFDANLANGQIAITAGGDVYFASDDNGDLEAGDHYNYLNAYKAVVIDQDLTIRLNGKPSGGSNGLKVENLMGGAGKDGNVYTITVSNTSDTDGPVKINFVNGLNSVGEKLDTVYDGSIEGGSADFLKTGAASLTINGVFRTKGTVETAGGTLVLNGSSSFATLLTHEETLTDIGSVTEVSRLQAEGGEIRLNGDDAVLRVSGSGSSLLDAWVVGTGTLDMSAGTLIVDKGGLSSETTLNLGDRAALSIDAGQTVETGYLTGSGIVDFQGVGDSRAVLKLTGNEDGVVSFAMEGVGTLVKAGSGTQTLETASRQLGVEVQSGKLITSVDQGSYDRIAVSPSNVASAELVVKNDLSSSGLSIGRGGILTLGSSSSSQAASAVRLLVAGNTVFETGSTLNTIIAQGASKVAIDASGSVTLPDRMTLNFINYSSDNWEAPLGDLVVMKAGNGFRNDAGATLASGMMFNDWNVTLEKSISLFYSSADIHIGADGTRLLATPVINAVNKLESIARSETAHAGADLFWKAGLQKSGSNLDLMLSSIMDDVKEGNNASASSKMAAAAGSTVTSILGAQQADYRYQQMLVRNRMTTMGLPEGYSYGNDLPLWNTWLQATGTYNRLNATGDWAGYQYNTWGGTFGVDANLSSRFTAGLAMSASYGKLTSEGADTLSGDTDMYYANLFGRYQKGNWGHNFILTYGWSTSSVDRSVHYGTGGYTGHGDVDGTGWGAMYEATYDISLNEKNSAIFQPLLNVSVQSINTEGYSEEGAGNAGLKVDDMKSTTATVSLGGRLMGLLGGNLFGRESLGELRVQVSQDMGDTRNEADVSFLGNPGYSRSVKASKAGSTGIQVGAGLNIPSGDQGTIFVESNADFRSRMTSVSGSIGYRYNF